MDLYPPNGFALLVTSSFQGWIFDLDYRIMMKESLFLTMTINILLTHVPTSANQTSLFLSFHEYHEYYNGVKLS